MGETLPLFLKNNNDENMSAIHHEINVGVKI
jgi:hypothetical protein